MCCAVFVIDVVQEAVVVASDHVGKVNFLPLGEGSHQSLKLLWLEGPKICSCLCGKELLVVQEGQTGFPLGEVRLSLDDGISEALVCC